MNMQSFIDGVKEHVLTPAAKGVVQAALDQLNARPAKRGGRSTLAVVAFIGVGVAIGVGAALLLSPATGKQVRAKVMGMASKTKASAAEGDVAEGDAAPAHPADKSAKHEGGVGANSHDRRHRPPIEPATT